jgi:ribonuclease VapC
MRTLYTQRAGLGRARRHRAGLNFGDCLTYAIASLADEPLLFVGDDFGHTDLVAA